MLGYEGGALGLQLVRLIINIAYLIVVLTCLLCFSLLLSTCIPLCAATKVALFLAAMVIVVCNPWALCT